MSDRERFNPHHFSQGRPNNFICQTIDTAVAPPSEQYAYWCDSILRGIDLDRPDESQRKRFRGQVASVASPNSEFHSARFDGFTGSRSPARIRQDCDEEVGLIYVRKGRLTSEQASDGAFHAGPGDFSLYDATVPTELAFEHSHIIQLDLPRAAVHRFGGRIPTARLVMEALRRSGLTSMLRLQLEALAAKIGHLTEAEQQVALEATEAFALAVLESALAAHAGSRYDQDRLTDREAHRYGLYLAACRHIKTNLANPDLDASRLAHMLGCSRATLYRIFSEQGTAVAECIRDLRLSRLKVLLERSSPTVPIGDLAARCGLYDAPNVSRMFRAKYAVSPSEMRPRSSSRERDRAASLETP